LSRSRLWRLKLIRPNAVTGRRRAKESRSRHGTAPGRMRQSVPPRSRTESRSRHGTESVNPSRDGLPGRKAHPSRDGSRKPSRDGAPGRHCKQSLYCASCRVRHGTGIGRRRGCGSRVRPVTEEPGRKNRHGMRWTRSRGCCPLSPTVAGRSKTRATDGRRAACGTAAPRRKPPGISASAGQPGAD
jgi:hypothetical protein